MIAIETTDTQTIDTTVGPFVSTDMANEVYHGERGHISRSTAHRYRGELGGRAQRYAEVYGKSLFGGNSATTFGSIVDAACEAEIRGIDWRRMVTVPPSDVLASDGSRRGKAFQEWRSALPLGAVECSAADFGKVNDIVESIREHEIASQLLKDAQHSQYSVFWRDDDGHARKARADGVTARCWFDLKTTSSEWRDLKWSFRRFGYDWQAVWYSQAARLCGWDAFEFPFIVVQTFAPYDVKVVRIPEPVLLSAEDEIKRTLDEIRRRRETQQYVPAAYHQIEELEF